MRPGQCFQKKSTKSGAGHSTAVPAVQDLGPSSPCYSPIDQDIADGGKTGIPKRNPNVQVGSLSKNKLKQFQGVQRSQNNFH